MNILFGIDVFLSYLNLPLIKNEQEILLANLFETSFNKFILSEKRIDFFNNTLKTDENALRKWRDWLANIKSNAKIIMKDDVINEITDENFDACNLKTFDAICKNNSDTDHYFLLATNYQDNYQNYLPHVCFYNQVAKPNKDFILLSLLANSHIVLRPIDFGSNYEINLVFALFLQLSNKSKKFEWYDSYCNEHRLFDSIIGKGYEIDIYTELLKNDYENSARRIRLKEKYGKNNTKIKYSVDKKIIHPRRLYVDRFTLETNHDFAAILHANDNWKITIEYCYDDNLYNDFEKIRNSYSVSIPNVPCRY